MIEELININGLVGIVLNLLVGLFKKSLSNKTPVAGVFVLVIFNGLYFC